MNGREIADLIDRRAEESRTRDEKILSEVSELKATTSVHSVRLDRIEANCARHDERWAEDTGRFQALELARAQTQTKELAESRRHWTRYIVHTLVAAGMAAVGAGLMKLLGG